MVDWQKNTGTNEKPLTIIDLHRERVREYERVRVRVIESQQEPEQVREKRVRNRVRNRVRESARARETENVNVKLPSATYNFISLDAWPPATLATRSCASSFLSSSSCLSKSSLLWLRSENALVLPMIDLMDGGSDGE